jgi:two-component system sensor histidine kinase/response regulator
MSGDGKTENNEAAKLRAEISALRRLTRRIGHDFNNVLQTIIGDTERLAGDELNRVQELSESILTAASTGVDLARELLAIGHAGDRAELTDAMAAARSGDVGSERPASSTVAARILVADDQEPIREYVRSVLMKAGHEVTFATNGADAVAAVRDADFALVLMDVHMPGMDGPTAIQKIRALDGPRAKVPIIVMSGSEPLEDAPSLAAQGMTDQIAKPFRAAALFQKLDLWLNRPSSPPISSSREETVKTPIDEVCELMGRPWVVRGLIKLTAQIDEAFGVRSEIAAKSGQLTEQAHALVGLSALLGFSTLSQLCSALEEASRYGRDVRLAFEQAKAAALQAREVAAGLIAAD